MRNLRKYPLTSAEITDTLNRMADEIAAEERCGDISTSRGDCWNWSDRESLEMIDSFSGYARAQAAKAAGAKHKVFDWDKAAEIIMERGATEASAGLSGDWDYTGGPILRDGMPIPADDTYVYLASNWATPELEIDGDYIDCWRYQDETPGWDSDTYWPESARAKLSHK